MTDRLINLNAAKDYIDSQKGRPFIGCTIGEAMKIMLDEVPPAQITPCDMCRFSPPSSADDKPCGFCPAEECEL